ncbi:hypothetical protein MMC11_008989 [Xylographa trunciseda]|nr:hypothetical protein [Xylographa trunciseda]
METSPSKRRKLSPATSVNASSYQTQPVHENNVSPRTPRQASFLSPTKASLARYNPSLLPGPKSAGEATQGSERASRVAYKQHGEKPGRPSNGLNPVALRSTTPTSSPDKLPARPQASTTSVDMDSISLRREMFDEPRRRSRTPGRESSLAKVLPILSAPVIPASPPRPAQAVEGEVEDTVSQQLELEFQAKATPLRQNDLASRPQDHIEQEKQDGEPELPLTPTQLGLEVPPQPPKGLFYSSPSRRSGRRIGSSIKSSPLKPHDPPRTDDGHGLIVERSSATNDATKARARAVRAQNESETIARKTLDQLLLRYQQLNNDVVQMEEEAGQTDVRSQEQVHELISIITSSNPTRRPLLMHKKRVSISSLVAQFMPFQKLLAPRKQSSSISSVPVPSHHPLRLQNPLPYLRAFTPLVIKSTKSLIPSSDRTQPWLQHHDITLTSPKNLLCVELNLSINAAEESVDSLALTSVSPWARCELGGWFNNQASIGDLPIIGWACGKYWEVALLRARCWERCHQQFSALIPAALELHESLSSAGIDRTDLKSKISSAEDDKDDNNHAEDADNSQPSSGVSDFDIRSQLGQQYMLFSASSISFLVTWRINLDWTGEAESCVSACASFPRAWQKADERASLGNIGEVFNRLLHDRGVFEAIRVIVALLYEPN